MAGAAAAGAAGGGPVAGQHSTCRPTGRHVWHALIWQHGCGCCGICRCCGLPLVARTSRDRLTSAYQRMLACCQPGLWTGHGLRRLHGSAANLAVCTNTTPWAGTLSLLRQALLHCSSCCSRLASPMSIVHISADKDRHLLSQRDCNGSVGCLYLCPPCRAR